MLSRKKDSRNVKEGVVGKYVKKDTPPEIPSKLIKLIYITYQIFIFLIIGEKSKTKICFIEELMRYHCLNQFITGTL